MENDERTRQWRKTRGEGTPESERVREGERKKDGGRESSERKRRGVIVAVKKYRYAW